jgi:hypothetical protein
MDWRRIACIACIAFGVCGVALIIVSLLLANAGTNSNQVNTQGGDVDLTQDRNLVKVEGGGTWWVMWALFALVAVGMCGGTGCLYHKKIHLPARRVTRENTRIEAEKNNKMQEIVFSHYASRGLGPSGTKIAGYEGDKRGGQAEAAREDMYC